MNLSEKIKSIALFALVLFSNFATAQAKNGDYAQVSSAYPAGYASLITDYEKARAQMIATFPQQKEQWRAWLEPGLNRGDSLYWWLLSEWEHQNNNPAMAYRAGTTASLLIKMDAYVCSRGRFGEKKVRNYFLNTHKFLLEPQPQETIKQSIVFAVHFAENLNENKQYSSGMGCFWEQYEEIKKYPERARHAKSMTFSLSKSIPSLLEQQRIAINEFKKEHAYSVIWREMHMSDAWDYQQNPTKK